MSENTNLANNIEFNRAFKLLNLFVDKSYVPSIVDFVDTSNSALKYFLTKDSLIFDDERSKKIVNQNKRIYINEPYLVYIYS